MCLVRRSSLCRIYLAAAGLLLLSRALLASGPGAPAKVQAPTEAIPLAGCVTADCHAGVKSHKTLHGPVGMNACDACHDLTDAKKHKYKLKREKAELCTYCHEFNITGVPVVHMPVAKGECIGCHNPHGGTDRKMTRETSVGEMCARCHDSVSQQKKHVHDPVAKQACDTCHTSHASRFPKLLYAEGEALCLSCHDKFRDQLMSAKFRHEALKDGCGKCHEAHASDLPQQLKQTVTPLCTSCHENVKQQATRSRYKHTVVTSDRACLNCHTAHGSDLAGLMNDLPIRSCMNCHKDKVKTDRGYVVAAMPELVDPTTIKHGPINDGQCGACHEVHGSNQAMFLAAQNRDDLYQSLAAENYKLCFTCHDLRLGQDEQTSSATAFRNGRQNLHYIHVNRGDRGRNCRICHSTHASHNERHVNDVTQFGNWEMPINFTRTATGGTCSPGCHQPLDYDRFKPATRPTTLATTGAATRAATRPTTVLAVKRPKLPPAPSTRPAPIHWTLTTSNGKLLKVPQAGRPTVLIFARSGHAQQAQILNLVKSATADGRRAQVVLILGGEEARDEARRLANDANIGWPIVPDTADNLFAKLEVHVWPTTLVLDSDGNQVARIAGVPDSLASALPAHIDFAAGKIDRAALVKRLEIHPTVGDTPAHKAQRQILQARRLMDSGMAPQARQTLIVALAEQPQSIPLKVELANLLMRAGQLKQATVLVEQLPATALAPGQREMLRARLLIEKKLWREATQVVTEALRLDPKSGEAHYLMGRICEEQGQWQQAAAEYRIARESITAEPAIE